LKGWEIRIRRKVQKMSGPQKNSLLAMTKKGASSHPDNAVSKNNADYEIGLCAARASSIIHFIF
jgi:hypothetical protein